MESHIEQLKSWIAEMRSYKSASWESLPDLDLYMDQVIILLEKQLGMFERDSGEKIITPSMINNYVKLGMLTPTVNKKYSKTHLAYLMAVCVLKQVLPISDITGIINSQTEKMDIAELYNMFNRMQDDALHSVAGDITSKLDRLPTETPAGADDLSMMALRLIVTANAYKLAAEKIVHFLKNEKAAKKESPADKAEDPKSEKLKQDKPKQDKPKSEPAAKK